MIQKVNKQQIGSLEAKVRGLEELQATNPGLHQTARGAKNN
jgi:hypothetical protein